jgi:hypothetical protein
MERGAEDTVRVLRAIRSLNYNRRLLPLIERRIEYSEATIRNHLLLRGETEDQVGPYEIRLDDTGKVGVTQAYTDDWSQMDLPLLR